MTLFAEHRMRRLDPALREAQSLYAQPWDDRQRRAWQLDRFNQEWRRIRETVPFYQDLSRARSLPDRFASWEQVVESLPAIDRTAVQELRERLASREKPAEWWRVTGGSTAQPIQLPAWHSENAATAPDMWIGRSWFDVRPADRLFLLWGHSHLLGSGARGRWNRVSRQLRDALVGYHRFSAYQLTEARMREAGDALLRFRPHYVVGYSVALDAFARANQGLARDFQRLGLKVVIGTAEGFPSPESVPLIEHVLGAPVGMEYGAVETTALAHSRPGGAYGVFWRIYFVEALESGPSGGRVVRVTSLYPRAFPLIRYELGDEIELHPEPGPAPGVTEFARVLGRCNDCLTLSDGARIHSEAITHAVRSCQKTARYQVIQEAHRLRLCLMTASPLTRKETEAIRRRLRIIHPELGRAEVQAVVQMEQTLSGKTRMIVCRRDG